MPNVIVNGNTYNGIQTVKLPLAEDASRFAYFNYDHSDEEGGGDFTPQITIEEGSYTVSGCTIAVSGNTVSVSNPPSSQIYTDISRINTGNSGVADSNVINKPTLFTIPAGSTVRLVATYNKTINPTSSNYVHSVQLYPISGTSPFFIAADVDRTTSNVFIGQKYVSADTAIGAISLFSQGADSDYTVEVEIYVNDERCL